LVGAFQTVRDGPDPEVAGKGYDSAANRFGLPVEFDADYKGPIDLDSPDWQRFQ
jgi:hypothetical protein